MATYTVNRIGSNFVFDAVRILPANNLRSLIQCLKYGRCNHN